MGMESKNLAWRLHTAKAVQDLDTCHSCTETPGDEFRFLAMAFASFRNDEERKERQIA